MQDHAKQRYIFGHLSLIRSLALDIPNGVAIVRNLDKSVHKKRVVTPYHLPKKRGALKGTRISFTGDSFHRGLS